MAASVLDAEGVMAYGQFEAVDQFDRDLLRNVRPELRPSMDSDYAVDNKLEDNKGYQVPEGSGRYNLVVIGAGAGGLVCAAAAAGLGARVALIERHLMGGDCLISGCVPSKALIAAARKCDVVCRVASQLSRREYFQNAMQNMRRIRAQLSKADSVKRFTELGVDVFLGDAKFVSRNGISVCDKTIEFSKCVIATGGRPQMPRIPGLAQCKYYTSNNIFTIPSLPERLVIIGTGPLGVEMAQSFRLFGSHVVCVCREFLEKEDREAAAIVKGELEKSEVEVVQGDAITRIESDEVGGKREMKIILNSGRRLNCDTILIATGRAANVSGLALDRAGVKYDQGGVVVNDFLQSSNSCIYAVGDVATSYKFTHVADTMARIAVRNSLFFGRQKFSAFCIPRCTYSFPEVASVGVCIPDSQRFDSYCTEFSEIDRCVIEGGAVGFVKIICKKGTDVIVGGTIVGQGAGDLISEVSVAMAGKVMLESLGQARNLSTFSLPSQGLGKLASVIHPYPTRAEAIRKCGDKYNKARLTPLVHRLFTRMLSLRR